MWSVNAIKIGEGVVGGSLLTPLCSPLLGNRQYCLPFADVYRISTQTILLTRFQYNRPFSIRSIFVSVICVIINRDQNNKNIAIIGENLVTKFQF